MNLSLKAEGLPEMIAKFDRAKGLPKTKAEVRRQGERIQYGLREYPPAVSRPAFWSRRPERRKRQIRGFFYYLRMGVIRVPYARTRRLARGWVFDYRTSTENMTATLVNTVPYASLVQGESSQTRYHQRSGWKTTTQVFKENEVRSALAIFQAADSDIRG